MKRIAVLLATITLGVCTLASDTVPVDYPDGYRDWRHVRSMVIEEGHALHGAFGGIHHLYANDKALRGYRSGAFPDGAVMVFDLLEATHTDDHAIVEGKRKVVGVMQRDSKRYAETGGWGFEGFAGDSKTERAVGANAKTACFDCHLAQKNDAYVFSALRDP
jgi:hypothetical protein